MLVGSAIAFGVAAAVLAFGAAVGRGYLLLWAVAAGAVTLMFLYGTVSSARAYTRFGPAGVRTRGLWGGTDEYPWDQIVNVAVQQVIFPNNYRTGVVWFVVATTTAGDRVRLGAPVSRTAGDPQFTRQFRQVRESWQRATGITDTPDTEAPGRPAGAFWLGAAAGIQVLALVVLFATLPYFVPAWAAHEGGGTPGVFTSGQRNCPQRGCSWFGTFTTADGHLIYATLEPGGPVIRAAGESVAAVDTGRKWIVYPAGGGTAWELPAAGVTAPAAVVLVLMAAEFLVPVRRRRARRRRAALPMTRPPRGPIRPRAAHPGARAPRDGWHGPPRQAPASRHQNPIPAATATKPSPRWLNRTRQRRRKPHP